MILLIISEIMFFVVFFLAFFHSSLEPVSRIFYMISMAVFSPFAIITLNTHFSQFNERRLLSVSMATLLGLVFIIFHFEERIDSSLLKNDTISLIGIAIIISIWYFYFQSRHVSKPFIGQTFFRLTLLFWFPYQTIFTKGVQLYKQLPPILILILALTVAVALYGILIKKGQFSI